jgi:hypothetical protein
MCVLIINYHSLIIFSNPAVLVGKRSLSGQERILLPLGLTADPSNVLKKKPNTYKLGNE